ncbi:MAG: hypothetical protein WAP51_03110, partial [Candidatus Sungiibacteriota bacterium]
MFWQRSDYQKQLEAIFLWLSNIAVEDDIISIEDLPRRKGHFRFKFPLRCGDAPQKLRALDGGGPTTFIVRRADFKNLPVGEWVRIFSSTEIEIFESKRRKIGAAPLRWGFSDEERTLSFKIARDALQKFLSSDGYLDSEYFNNLPGRFRFYTDLDVA